MKIRGPFVTLGAVAAVGAGIWLGNVSQEPDTATPAAATPAAASATALPPPPTEQTPPPPPAVAFPPKADYTGTIPARSGDIALDITVDGDNATAYACDNYGVEVWLSGPAASGAMKLANKDGSSRLDGRLEGDGVAGTLRIAERQWDFTTTAVQSHDNVG